MVLDVLLIGHLDKGRVVKATDSEPFLGGAVYFAGAVLALLGLRVGVLTRLAKQDANLLQDFYRWGVEVFPVWTPTTTGIENVYPDPDSDRRYSYLLGNAGTFQEQDLPEVEARLYYLGTVMAGEIDLPFLRAVAARGPVALDAQGCLRTLRGRELVTGEWDWAAGGLPLVRYLKVDDREAQALTGEEEFSQAAETLSRQGPQEVMITHREGVLVLAEGKIWQARFKFRSLAGRTGRGDTCFSAYLGRRLLGDSPEGAVKFAAALTSLKLEQPAPFRGMLEEVWRLAAEL
ncbi:MAG TPA: carbohydrate kinase [Candidatus Acetothermia bacterium]|nr:carbohydrate kinase [Candidatus Acetothermia bacterium]